MKKSYKIQNIDCAACALKIEDGIKKIPGVKTAWVNFIMGKLTLEAEDGAFEGIIEQAEAVCKKIDRKCTIVR